MKQPRRDGPTSGEGGEGCRPPLRPRNRRSGRETGRLRPASVSPATTWVTATDIQIKMAQGRPNPVRADQLPGLQGVSETSPRPGTPHPGVGAHKPAAASRTSIRSRISRQLIHDLKERQLGRPVSHVKAGQLRRLSALSRRGRVQGRMAGRPYSSRAHDGRQPAAAPLTSLKHAGVAVGRSALADTQQTPGAQRPCGNRINRANADGGNGAPRAGTWVVAALLGRRGVRPSPPPPLVVSGLHHDAGLPTSTPAPVGVATQNP